LPPPGDADVDEDPEEEPLPPELLRSTKEWKGWRVSYCKLESYAGKAERLPKYLSKLPASVGDPCGAKRGKPMEHKTDARLASQHWQTKPPRRDCFFLA
jgi:hypothetical protein